MAKELSPVAKSLLTLLNNIDELIVKSNDRKEAKSVMDALTAYAVKKNFELPISDIENFYAVLLDGRPITLSFIVKDIAQSIVAKDQGK